MAQFTRKVGPNSRIGFIGGVTAILLAGCVAAPETKEHASGVRVIADSPVHVTISAGDVRVAKTGGRTVLALPDDKLSSSEFSIRLRGFSTDGRR